MHSDRSSLHPRPASPGPAPIPSARPRRWPKGRHVSPPAGRRVPAILVLLNLVGCAGQAGQPSPNPADERPIRIDGEWDDWANREPIWRSANEQTGPAHSLQAVGTAHDDGAFYLRLTLASETNLQAMPGTLRLTLDADGPAAGPEIDGLPGADHVIAFSSRTASNQRIGIRHRLAADTLWTHAYDIGLHYGPTHSDRHFEIRLGRRPSRGAPLGPSVRFRIATIDEADRVVAITPVLTHEFTPATRGVPLVSTGTLDRPPGTSLRVITWNVGDRTILERPERFRQALRVLAPDAILLDELHPDITPDDLRGLVAGVGGEPWTVVLGTSGGRQRTAVMARQRFHATVAPALRRVDYPDSLQDLRGLPMSRQMAADLVGAPVDGIPMVGGIIETEGRRVLLVAVDLLCCGSLRGPEERARRMTALRLNEAIRAALAPNRIDAVVIGGDLNLVGTRRPLELLGRSLDPISRADLTVVPTPRLTGLSNATWEDPGPFPPGRLDYLLVSGSVLTIRRAFPFHPGDLSADARARLGLDSVAATDHLPVVADLTLTRAPNGRP